ncbi:hypothetical protein [Methylosinus sp. LW3]|nr:hypothetical protein [Methylosinus sp. LW3]
MTIGSMMNAMRDPAGVPGAPGLFEALFVGTWVLHIAFVLLTLGACALAVAGFLLRKNGPHWARLSAAMTGVAKIGVSLLIVLGVAPLLFTQVIYDPQWYASNVLSASWAIGFIATLIVGYCSWFVFYAKNEASAKRVVIAYAVVALVIFLLDGLIMHALTYQALLPERWMEWYAPGGGVDTSGARLHAVQWPRYLFIISLSAPAVGVFLLAYADYFAPRSDIDPSYLAFARTLGRKIAVFGSPVSLALFLWWTADLPPGGHLVAHPLAFLLALSLPALAWLVWTKSAPGRGYLFLGAGVAMLLLLSIWREIIRVSMLSTFGYSIDDYKVNVDWPSAILFATTLLGVGGLVGGFYLTLCYQAGRVRDVYFPGANVARLSSAAVAVLIVWIATFFTYGAAVWVKNVFLP